MGLIQVLTSSATRMDKATMLHRNISNSAKSNGGFTMLEIMIVVSIIALLAVIAIPSFVRARTTSEKSSCLNNLREIDGAKQQWALENNKVNADTPTTSNLIPYFKGNVIPECPGGGSYAIGNVGSQPTCNISGHTY